MEIICGETTFKVKDIAQCYIGPPTEKDLYIAEKRCNGSNVHYEEIVPTLTHRINCMPLLTYTKPIVYALVSSGPEGKGGQCWPVRMDLGLPYSLSTSDPQGKNTYGVIWKYWGYTQDDVNREHPVEHTEILRAADLLPAINLLLTAFKFKGRLDTLAEKDPTKFDYIAPIYWAGWTYKMRVKVDPAVREALDNLRSSLVEALVVEREVTQRIQEREAIRQAFYQAHADAPTLVIKHRNHYRQSFMEGLCGFDIYEKEAEIREAIAVSKQQYLEAKRQGIEAQQQLDAQAAHEEKLRKSYDRGEKVVNYELKWLLFSNPNLFYSIAGDCETRFRYNVIFLKNPDLLDEPQEFDHLLVTPAGIIAIETKNWRDQMFIRPDGKWIRRTENGDIGADSPQMQIARHEALLNSMFPGVPIHSILCFTNRNAIVDGVENFTTCPIVMLERLRDYISKICETKTYSIDEMKKMVETIESFKINRQPEVYECIPSRIGLNNNGNDNSTDNSLI